MIKKQPIIYKNNGFMIIRVWKPEDQYSDDHVGWAVPFIEGGFSASLHCGRMVDNPVKAD